MPLATDGDLLQYRGSGRARWHQDGETLATLQALAELTEAAGSRGKVWRHSRPLPEAGPARTASPLVAQLPAEARDLYGREHFGPVGLVMVATDRDEALRCAARDAGELGSIASYAYTTDAAFAEQVEDAFVGAGASVGINLLRQLPINYAAAYSDFHVTGLNPAGTLQFMQLHLGNRRICSTAQKNR